MSGPIWPIPYGDQIPLAGSLGDAGMKLRERGGMVPVGTNGDRRMEGILRQG